MGSKKKMGMDIGIRRIVSVLVITGISLLLCCSVWARELYVSSEGTPDGDGSKEKPLDLKTALTNAQVVKPGDTVWLMGGTYKGPFVAKLSGTEEAPIIYRAVRDERVTLAVFEIQEKNTSILSVGGTGHVWFWGFEIAFRGKPENPAIHYGHDKLSVQGLSASGKAGLKFINLVVHDCIRTNGFGGSTLGGEYYGCLSYRNGLFSKALGHGWYTQNRPEGAYKDKRTNEAALKALPWRDYSECLVFNNFGWGMHSYATAPILAKHRYRGVVAWGNGDMKEDPKQKQTVNFLSGGQKFDDMHEIRECFTYYPDKGNFKRGVDLGYGGDNGRYTIEDSHFIGGRDALWIRQCENVIFKRNTLYTANGSTIWLIEPKGSQRKEYVFEENTYYRGKSIANEYLAGENFQPVKGTPPLFRFNGKNIHDLAAWQKETGVGKTSKVVNAAPKEMWAFLRSNKYEPDRAHLIIYNWPKKPMVTVDLGKLWKVEDELQLKDGQEFSIVNVEDIWGKPEAKGKYGGKAVELKMTGKYAPEFAVYLVRKHQAGM